MPDIPVRKVAGQALTPGATTPGIVREQALVAGDLWSGRARTEAGVTSGWHHHGDHDTVIYVVHGAIAVETADGVVQGDPGDFLHVPAHTVHRESNPTDGSAEVVLVRRGTGPVVINVDPPAGAG
ncbi:MAG: Cupin 2 conserved barrel domain protein [Frankiales bacterium]|nr:Cupin 2 conserved barrel domain protein [Frankiales bacterium]